MSILNELDIAELQDRKKTYETLGFSRTLHKGVPMPDFISADEFSAITEGFKGGRMSIDTVEGKITINDGEVDRIVIGLIGD